MIGDLGSNLVVHLWSGSSRQNLVVFYHSDNLVGFRMTQSVVCVFSTGIIIKRKSGEIPCPLAVEAFAAHLSYICKYDDKYSKYVEYSTNIQLIQRDALHHVHSFSKV